MRRKVSRIGPTTLMVSLPSKWVKENKISKGDELDLDFNKDKVTFSKSHLKKGSKEIILNIDSLGYFYLTRYLTILYRMHYSKIILTYSKKEIFHDKRGISYPIKGAIKKAMSRFMGAEVISQTSDKTEIEFFVSNEKTDLDKIGKRIYFLIKETMEELFESIGKDYGRFHEEMINHHDNIVKFINYFLRELSNSDLSEDEQKVAYSFYIIVDKLIDSLRDLSGEIDKFGSTPKTTKYLKEAFEIFYLSYEMVDKEEISQEVVKKRRAFLTKLKNDKLAQKESGIISELKVFMDIINEFVEYVIIRTINKKTDS